MASGLVPTTSQISERSLPPYSAGAICLHFGASQGASGALAEIVGVGLELETHRRRRNDVIAEAALVTVGDRRFLRGEGHPHLRVGVARAVPAGQWIGAQGLLPLELEQPATGVGLARLCCP